MKKTLHVGVEDPERSLLSTLPPDLAARERPGLPPYTYYYFDEASFADARRLLQLAKSANKPTLWVGSLDGDDDSLEPDHIYKITVRTVLRGAQMSWNGYLKQRACDECGLRFDEIDDSARPKLSLPSGERVPATFSIGNAVIIRRSFLEALPHDLMHGSKLVEVHPDCLLLTSTIDIGLETWDDSAKRCGTCGRLRVLPGWFPLFARPKQSVNHYFSRQDSPLIPIVDGKLAKALRGTDYKETAIAPCGWYPDGLDNARYPDLG